MSTYDVNKKKVSVRENDFVYNALLTRERFQSIIYKKKEMLLRGIFTEGIRRISARGVRVAFDFHGGS